MNLVGQHISNLRGLIKKYSRTPNSFTDQFLFEILVGARAVVLKQKLLKYHRVSQDNFLRFCVPLEIVKAHTCDCVPDEISCLVVRTKYKIPAVLTSRNNDLINIYLLNGKSISLVSQNYWLKVKKFTDEYAGTFINGYIYFWNLPLKTKLVEVSGLFGNPIELANIPSCDETGNEQGTCFSVLNTEFPLEEEYKLLVYQRALELLNIPLQLPSDLTNDSNEFIQI